MEEEGVEEIPKEILNAIDSFSVESDEEFMDFNSVMFNNATEWIEQTSFNWKLCLIHNIEFSDTFFCTDNTRVIGQESF